MNIFLYPTRGHQAMNPSGSLVAVGFHDKLRLYDLVHGPPGLKKKHDFPLKAVHCVCFDKHGSALACATGINVVVLDVASLAQRGPPLTGHVKHVRCVQWSPDGSKLWSTGMDGNVFGWDLWSREDPGRRLDDAQLLNRTGSGYECFLVVSPSFF